MNEKIVKENVEEMLNLFNLQTDKDGYIKYENGEYVPSFDNRERIHKDNVAFIKHDESQINKFLLIPYDCSSVSKKEMIASDD